MVVNFHSNLGRWRKHFTQLLSIHAVDDCRRRDIHTVRPLVPQPSAFEIELTFEKLKITR